MHDTFGKDLNVTERSNASNIKATVACRNNNCMRNIILCGNEIKYLSFQQQHIFSPTHEMILERVCMYSLNRFFLIKKNDVQKCT